MSETEDHKGRDRAADQPPRERGYALNSALGRISGFALWEHVPGLWGRGLRSPPYYALVYTTAGAGCYEDANGLRCALEPGDLIVLFPGFPVMYGAKPGADWSEFWMTFDGPVFELWDSTGLLDRTHPVWRVRPVDYWLQRFQAAVTERTESIRAGGLAAVCRLQQVLTEAQTASERAVLSEEQIEWLATAKGVLEAGADTGWTLADAARRLRMTGECFRKRFTRLAGVSPGRYRTEHRMGYACRLLLGTGLTVKAVAFKLGFADEFHFSHRFKQAMGCSPRTFRRGAPRARR
ncbi:MAG: helix-turn-helix transcriptional regulator [Kiritimatiellae bacterium]|nr:helix-turn-helix transcriptional regulator [Kiritimatiellia bacterium]